MNAMTTASRFRSLIPIALFSILYSSLSALPVAAESFGLLTVTVKFGDLDISQPQGADVLYGRIRSAAEKVCSPFDDRNLARKMRLDACIHKSVADAVTAVNEPALLAVYSAKMGKTQPKPVASLQNR
jgi:UrcA family protein